MRGAIRSNEMSNVARALRDRRKSAGALIQRLRKDGKWGKPTEVALYGSETPTDAIKRLNDLNPGSTYRLADTV